MSVSASLVSTTAKDPVVLSYKALRKAVGFVAISLPFVLVVPYAIHHCPHIIQDSISAYYFTGLRNVFVGYLCAISMFMICARGYDRRDEYAGFLSALCAIGVAFSPMDPTKIKEKIACSTPPPFPPLHFAFAIILFLTLGYFCLVLFRITAGVPTRQKLQRNRIYKACGWTIYTAMAIEGLCSFLLVKLLPSVKPSWEGSHHLLVCEAVCLWAFGFAWLVKGGAFFQDVPPDNKPSLTTDSVGP